MLTRNDRILCGIYAAVAVIALIATWWHNIAFFRTDGLDLVDFVAGGYANHAASSLTNDLALVALAAVVLMVVEAHRLKIPYVWLYVVGSFAVAISVTFPLFLIARQRALAALREATM